MTRKHFQAIAQAISSVNAEPAVRAAFAERIADELARFNSQFNRSKFLEAAGAR